ncbi:MAG: hypothetical protein ACTSR6_06030 [Candidatus Heimdallarchaeota archaeon]
MKDVILKGIEYGKKLNADFIDVRYQNKYVANYQSLGSYSMVLWVLLQQLLLN